MKRESLSQRVERLRRTAFSIAQASIAAGAAWLIATEAVGHAQPFFAPMAAILAIGLSYGQRGRRAAEIAIGVALGIGVADLLVLAIGSGAWQLVLVVALAMIVAVLLDGGILFVNQVAISAVLVVTLQPAGGGLSGARFVDALVGAAVALIVTTLLPRDPLPHVRREADPVFAELSAVVDDIADALDDRDRDAAVAALARARQIDASARRLTDSLGAAREMATLSPRRGDRGLGTWETAAPFVDLAVRNVRVLARGAVRALDLEDRVPPLVVSALRDLAESVRVLGARLADPASGADPQAPAVRAAARATEALEQTQNLSASVLVGQVRATATDLLRALGLEEDDAIAAVREARARLGAAG